MLLLLRCSFKGKWMVPVCCARLQSAAVQGWLALPTALHIVDRRTQSRRHWRVGQLLCCNCTCKPSCQPNA
jgi:hypothetical protein